MNVEIKSGGDVGVAEYHTHRLIVAAAFNAAGCEGMTQSVKYNVRYADTSEQPLEIIAICAWVGSSLVIAHHEISFGALFNDAQGLIEQWSNRNFPLELRVLGDVMSRSVL